MSELDRLCNKMRLQLQRCYLESWLRTDIDWHAPMPWHWESLAGIGRQFDQLRHGEVIEFRH